MRVSCPPPSPPRCVHLQVLCHTYTAETVPALKALSRDLAAHTEALQARHKVLRDHLAPYDNLDHVYVALLQEYRRIKVDLAFFKGTGAVN